MNTRSKFHVSTGALIALLAAGCAHQPQDGHAPLPVSTGHYALPATAEAQESYPLEWWESFGDPAMLRLVEEASARNLSVAAAAARMAEARELARGERGRNQPSLNLAASATRQQASENGQAGRQIAAGAERVTSNYRGTLDAAWELDLFGRNAAAADAADARASAAQFSHADLLNAIRAETALSYLAYRSAEKQAAVMRENITLRRRTLELVETRVQAGTENDLSLARARQSVERLEAQLPVIEAQADSAALALAILTVQEPQRIRELLNGSPAVLPEPSPLLGVGLPSELMQRRPDVRRAGAELEAAAAELQVRSADLYPRLSLVGVLGQESLDIDTLLNGSSSLWSIGPSLTLPIFNGDRLRSLRDAQRAKVEQALAAYHLTVITALRDVERGASAVFHAKRQLQHAIASAGTAAHAAGLAQARYTAGILPLDQLLDVQESSNLADEQLALARIALASELVRLGKALGGGW